MAMIKKVNPGDKLKIPAAAYNAMANAADAFSQNAFHMGPGQDEPGDNLVLVKNNSGSDVATGEPLGVDGPIFSPTDDLSEFKYNFSIKGVAVTTADYAGNFVIAAEPIEAGKLGRGYLSGVFPALLTIVDADDLFADIVDDSLKTASSGGLQILWKETGTGTGKWALVRFGTSSILPVGGDQYQVLQKDSTTDGDASWDWVRAHGDN